MAGLTSSTIGRKYAMALSAIFLLIFLVMHLSVNLLSVFGADAYNNASQFMGYNPLIQFVMQPVLIFAVVFHFVMGFVLEIKNQKARPVKYESNNPSRNSTWMSRNMIISGAVILAFIFLHMYDFWFHEMNYKYVDGLPIEESRFWGDLHAKFADAWRVILYIISFILLGLHLGHGFQSSFQSIGARHPKYTPVIMALGKWYSILIPAGFIFIAIYHFVTQ
ncbi:succinate dehydrogenase cytochrome b subunit [Chryseobacterium shandongense]|jgi:succinate dehydrogenase / fumarate reductase cytochrome b subunit|uniref:Succinate dehydrogenase cytochrome b subunit n=1 Tax=Chryseobacterium shandongense TaxID=1493872 RepID=A0AAD0YFH6_9FLAO|nr:MULTISPECIES: succinate dehydrogenase cytochrome b subunit [Chryseobacterium]AZA88030.1 succinate dehydrogenase cytochrome b subunit [Chryseobacterium shandongense]AZA96591.1 succinate dehydrogenase cytochrome b subunit [Chryseobacterium shandongense]